MDKITSPKNFQFILPCPKHLGEQITRACNDLNCINQCLFCPQCEKEDKNHIFDHRNKMRPISEVIILLSKELDKYSKVERTANSFLLDDSEKNLKLMAKHLKDQRTKIEQDFKKLLDNVLQILKQNMLEILSNIDKQYEVFVRNYELFKASFTKTAVINPFTNYSNISTLVSKLKSIKSIKEQSELLSNIKRHLNEKQSLHSTFKQISSTNDIFKVEDLLKNQMKDPPTYNNPDFDIISKKINNFAQKLHKIYENHIFFYPLKSALPIMVFRNLKFPKGPEVLKFEINNNNKGLVLNLDSLKDFIQLNPTEPLETNHDKPIQNIVAISNEIIATGGGDNLIKLWDLTSKKCLKNLYGNTNYITSLCLFHLKSDNYFQPIIKDFRRKFSEYGFLLINGSFDKNLVIWDSDFDKSTVNSKFMMIRGHDYYISCMQELCNGENLVTGDEKGFIIIWNILAHKSIFKSVTSKISHRKSITSINVIDKLQRFATSDLEGIMLIWQISYQKNIKNGLETIIDCKIIHIFKENYGAITNIVAKASNPNILISCHEKGKLVVWKIKDDLLKIKSHVLIDDIQDSIHQIAIVELKEKPKEYMVFCLLSQKHGICVVDSEGKITAAIKFGSDEDLISNSLNPNHKFQFVGNTKPLLAILNQSKEKKTVNILEINI